MEKLKYQVQTFIPYNEQELRDKELLLSWIESGADILEFYLLRDKLISVKSDICL